LWSTHAPHISHPDYEEYEYPVDEASEESVDEGDDTGDIIYVSSNDIEAFPGPTTFPRPSEVTVGGTTAAHSRRMTQLGRRLG